MISSASPEAQVPDAVRRLAGVLAGRAPDSVTALAGGNNNRVYRVACPDVSYALKRYPLRPDDPRERLAVEFETLRFLETQGIATVPRAIAADHDNRLGLYSWEAGEAITAPGATEVSAALDLVAKLHALGPSAEILPPASEACLSGRSITDQTGGRLRQLLEIAGPRDFLEDAFAPAFESATARARDGYANAGWDFEAEIELRQRTLSPSDFGFHNALRRADGSLVFLDFEYFGWDDPSKLACDFLLHPGMKLDEAARRRFAAGVRAIFAGDADFARRCAVLYPLFGMRWCMILLNEYLPERRTGRAFARGRQLEKARGLLDRLHRLDEGFPDGP
jgi:hypothetical protein